MSENRHPDNQHGMDLVCGFSGYLAHELNNLLTPVIACAQMLEESPSPDDITFCAQQITDAGERIMALTKKLQLIGSRRGGGMARLVELMDAACRSAMPVATGQRIELTEAYRNRTGLASAWVAMDPGQFTFVAGELLRNAIEAMPQGGMITMDLEEDAAGFLVLTVADRGSGMSAEVRDRICEPFFTTRSQARDRGLGLTIVYGIVHRAGGSIECESEAGRGTTIRIRLPRASQPA